ncbi:MAG: hypothetical protein KHW70_10175 [Clostridium sp.]|nr:hypothetical protein [Clostridium sp.]
MMTSLTSAGSSAILQPNCERAYRPVLRRFRAPAPAAEEYQDASRRNYNGSYDYHLCL